MDRFPIIAKNHYEILVPGTIVSGYLQDLAIIDMELRYTFIQLTLDIEHFAKMDLLRAIENHNEDGYQIVSDFLNSLSQNRREHIESELRQNQSSYYTTDIYNKPELFMTS